MVPLLLVAFTSIRALTNHSPMYMQGEQEIPEDPFKKKGLTREQLTIYLNQLTEYSAALTNTPHEDCVRCLLIAAAYASTRAARAEDSQMPRLIETAVSRIKALQMEPLLHHSEELGFLQERVNALLPTLGGTPNERAVRHLLLACHNLFKGHVGVVERLTIQALDDIDVPLDKDGTP